MTLMQQRAGRGGHVHDQTLSPPPRAARQTDTTFEQVYDATAVRVFAYARRHVGADDARDIVADVFLVAWRRRDDIPGERPDDALPWLLVVARNTIANHRRKRRLQLITEPADVVIALDRLAPREGVDHVVIDRGEMLRALAELTVLEREALLLVAWDGLHNADAAAVAGCSVRAFEVRLSRARARLRRELTTDEEDRP